MQYSVIKSPPPDGIGNVRITPHYIMKWRKECQLTLRVISEIRNGDVSLPSLKVLAEKRTRRGRSEPQWRERPGGTPSEDADPIFHEMFRLICDDAISM